MERERANRYGRAVELAEEVRRWIADEPIDAVPDSRAERLARWGRRNRTWVRAGAVVLLVGLIALGVAYFRESLAHLRETRLTSELRESNLALGASNLALDAQRQKAEDREQLAIDAVKRFRDAVARNPELKDNPSLESLRKSLLKEPLAFFSALRDRLQSDASTRPESLARLARAQLDLGFTIRDIGQIPDAAQRIQWVD